MKGKAMALVLGAAAVLAAGCASTGSGDGAGGSGAAASVPANPWQGTGFSVWVVNDRWWVFQEGTKDLAEFLKGGEPAKQVTRIRAGPDGQTLKAPDVETLDAFAAWRPGFTLRVSKGRTWIFREGSKEAAAFDKLGEPTIAIGRIGAGPNGSTLKAPDRETLDAWAAAK